MTEINGLRLAYRGFVSGLAGAYVWAAIAMLLAALTYNDPLAPLRPIATAVTPMAGTAEFSFVLGLAVVQAAGGLVGMCFAYFFARFFTVRATLGIAAPVVALLAWALITVVLSANATAVGPIPQGIAVIATVGFGLVLGASVPVRRDVTRQSGSPST
jgi:hypothetical protein